MLRADELEELSGIVGPEWVSTDPCMMETYSFYMNPEILNPQGGRWLPRPAAVVMPANSGQVQEIVRLCNRTDLMVKPISTGWGTWAAVSRERVIVLDLKRMDRIIDIDVKNQVAVIEPYVKAIILQNELFKQGLNVHVASCGGNHSILASVAAAWGYGLTGSSMGYSGRNLLGVEWVLPTGELLTLGSAGSRAGWFTADGPGPSLRGILRGFVGTFGALGVFTKCAVKLYRWDGPSEFEVTGKSPHYLVGDLPATIGFFTLAFPSAAALADAGYALGEAEISYAEFRLPPFMTALGTTDTNAELKDIWEIGLFQKVARYSLVIAVMGYSQREYEWKVKALKEILREGRGVIMPLQFQPVRSQYRFLRWILRHIEDPLALLRTFPFLQDVLNRLPVNPDLRRKRISALFWLLIRHATNTQGTFRPSQGMFTSLGSFDTWDLGIRQSEWVAAKKQGPIAKGLILDDGGDSGCGSTYEYGHLGYIEGIGLYAPKDAESVKAVAELVDEGNRACIDHAMGTPISGYGQLMNAKFGPHCWNYHLWMERIKRALDPNMSCDPFFYAVPPQTKADP